MAATDRAYKAARRLRRRLSLPEAMLWARLRGSAVRFRRQHPLGSFVLDFYCASAKLAIEVDGAIHGFGDRPSRDAARTQWIEQQGVRVIRVAAADILADADRCAESIIAICFGRGKPLHRSAVPSGPPPHGSAAGRNE